MYNEDINHEHSTKKRLFKNKKVFILLLLTLLAVLGTSFALWQLTFTQTGTNVITTGCLKLTLTEDTDAINLTDATPTTDEEGKKLTPFTFTLENTCTTETTYVINLETLSSGEKILADRYVKASLTDGSNEVFTGNLLETYVNEEKVISEATKAYKLHRGKLGNKEKISFNLRLWMDEQTGTIDEVMNASWQGKITVTASYIPTTVTKNMMKSTEMVHDYCGSMCYVSFNSLYSNNAQYMVTKVVFQDNLNPYTSAIEVVDLSEKQDESVLGYYVRNENTEFTTYTLYIQADGKIKANYNASYYFASYDPITAGSEEQGVKLEFEGIENIDMSLVTDMSHMFNDCGSLTATINITNPNVENYEEIFTFAATLDGAQITVNYTAETSDLVDRMIATKSEDSNVVKGSLIS